MRHLPGRRRCRTVQGLHPGDVVPEVHFGPLERSPRNLSQAVWRGRSPHPPQAGARALHPARGRQLLRPLRAAERGQYRRADQHRAGADRGRQPRQARRRVPQHRLQLRGQPRPRQGPQPPPQERAGGFRQARARPAPRRGDRGHHRRVLHLPDLALRLGRGQEGGRVLHALRRLAPAGEAGRPEARRHDLRPGLRVRLAADPGVRRRSGPRTSPSTARR